MGLRRTASLALFLASLAFEPSLTGNAPRAEPLESSPSAAPERELIVLTLRGPTTYQDGPDGPSGFEHDLAAAFARSIGARARFVIKPDRTGILDALASGKGDIGAAGLVRPDGPGDPDRAADGILFGPSYQTVTEQVVCGRRESLPAGVADLVGKRLVVPARSGHEETLRKLRLALPPLQWESPAGVKTPALLGAVARGKWDCTLAKSTLVALERRYRPRIAVAFDLGGERSLAWAIAPGRKDLEQEIRTWLAGFRESGGLDALVDRYYGFIEDLSRSALRGFRADVENVLPDYRPLFERAADRHDLPWTLIAALAYQESGWNPAAQGPKGTSGMMMLARGTARMYGVTNPLDPAQSIEAGAAYLARMRAAVPRSVDRRDRDWFALAAYNIGVAHMKDAYALTARLGKDPDRWADVQEVLPLLSEDRYQKMLKYGFARGAITVEHVKSVRNYKDLIERALGGGGSG